MRPVTLDHTWLWAIDHTPHVSGFVLLLLGVTVVPAALPLGWTALGLALFAWLAEVEGFALPRPGRSAIAAYGCFEVPLAFVVRHEGRWLLLSREEDPIDGGWASEYCVREAQGLRAAGLGGVRGGFPAPQERTAPVTARVPADALRFEHRERASYVVTASLARALSAAR
jgi:hypothetical protein